MTHFNGPDYDPELDHERLTGQIKRIFDLIQDARWRTLGEIEEITGDPPVLGERPAPSSSEAPIRTPYSR